MKFRNLKFLQNDMEAWITNTSAQENGIHRSQIIREIVSTTNLSAEERVEIYRNMYWVRMVDALHEEFPALVTCMGHEQFHEIATAYIQNHPSQSYTMRYVGARFPEFLKLQSPEMPEAEAWGEFAAFQAALNAAFHAPLAARALLEKAASKTGEEFMNLTLTPSPSFATLTTTFKVTPLLQAFIKDELKEGALPEKGYEHILIYRLDSRSLYQVLDQTTWDFLGLLMSGHTIDSSLDKIAPSLTTDEECAQLLSFLKSWITQGVLTI